MIAFAGLDTLDNRLAGADGGRQLVLGPAFLDATKGQTPAEGRGTHFAFVGIWHLEWTRRIL